MTKNEATQWWKESFSQTDLETIPSQCPNIAKAIEIWTKISPVILANTNKHDNEEDYWKSVQTLMQKLVPDQSIPDPKSKILDFWNILYDNKTIIAPETPEQCLPLINYLCPTPCNDFFVLDFPRSINNPMLALRTYQYLHTSNHPKCVGFISENGAIGRLMDFYLPFLTPLLGQYDNMYWQYRLEMCDLIVSLVVSHFEEIPLIDNFVISLNSKITSILSDAPLEYAADFVRYAIQINKVSMPRIKPETATKRILNLLAAAPPGTAAHAPLVRFAYKMVSDFVATESLAKYLINQGVTCSYDLEILATIAINPQSNAQKIVICQLASVMVLDPIYGRSAALLFAKVLSRVKELNAEAKEWVILFIRRLIVFIALAFNKKRYSGKIARIAEILTHPDLKEIGWLNDEIIRNISAMKKEKLSPPYFDTLFETVEVPEDDKWKSDYEIFSQEHPSLKRFPFGPTGNALLENEQTKPKTKKKGPVKKAGAKAGKKPLAKKGKAAATAAGTKTEGGINDGDDPKAPPKKKGRRPKWNP
ncbi:hypothetical protein TRFO_30905 [Tritrichomonas foetus]|uniref:Uncharacterized protein n=1 Tax=Tritrichomonas foetus TaxID=1144522 RepID=A0A1J4JX79_9EUKA|nr:hypothetical protein TRFO_30905 [Tritrichomonas foetus]|eukprot:OHT02142.1 hypothetical protein TRFO_30905 [Tritrichomonas foetus]